jgi:hypothetical protein
MQDGAGKLWTSLGPNPGLKTAWRRLPVFRSDIERSSPLVSVIDSVHSIGLPGFFAARFWGIFQREIASKSWGFTNDQRMLLIDQSD